MLHLLRHVFPLQWCLRTRLRTLACGLALWAALPASAMAATLTVFAAASLTNAYEEIGAAFHQKTGHVVRFSFAASSALARQIESGAPADLFASADEQWMDYLATRKRIVPDSRFSPVGNQLVMVAPTAQARPLELRPGFDLAGALGKGRLATGDPAHVPVGKYAQSALTALGVWNIAEPKLVRADSVRAALALVERGEVPLGIVYATDAAVARGVAVVGRFPASSHAPIQYPVAIVAGRDAPPAREFLAFLRSETALAIYRKYGFLIR